MKSRINDAFSKAVGQIGPQFESESVVAKILDARSGKTMAQAPETAPQEIRSDIDDLPQTHAPAHPNAYAVIIGVRKYRQKLPEADFADSDARLMSKYMIQTLGFQEENVATLINDQASRSDFEKHFEKWLPNRVELGSEVFVYYSGHGAPNPTTGDAYLVPFDGDPTYLQETAYPLKRMYSALAKLPADKITVVMDSCFSGAGGRSVLAKGAKPLVNMTVVGAVPQKLTVLSASAADQISHTYDEKGHGLFTYYFLKGLKEKAGKNSMDIKEAFDYAAPLVSRVARREYNTDQVPQLQEGR
jgi:hypothetical protein